MQKNPENDWNRLPQMERIGRILLFTNGPKDRIKNISGRGNLPLNVNYAFA
jgi:hypothetical protein